MRELEFLKSLLRERKEEYERLLSCCMDMSLACRLEELNELIRIVDVRLDMLRKAQTHVRESRG